MIAAGCATVRPLLGTGPGSSSLLGVDRLTSENQVPLAPLRDPKVSLQVIAPMGKPGDAVRHAGAVLDEPHVPQLSQLLVERFPALEGERPLTRQAFQVRHLVLVDQVRDEESDHLQLVPLLSLLVLDPLE